MQHRASRTTVVIGSLLVSAASLADAQLRSAAEISSGYQLQHAFDSGFAPRGWFVSGGPYVIDGIAVVGEIARNDGARAVVDVAGLGSETPSDDTTYMGGVLWRRPARPVTVFARFLVGARRVVFHRGMTGNAAGWSAAGPAMQAGGGIDIHVTARSAVRLAGTYLRFAGDEVRGHSARLAVGTVYRFDR